MHKPIHKHLIIRAETKNTPTDQYVVEKWMRELIEDIGKNVRTMPQIKIDGELIGGYNQLVEHFADQKKVNYKGEIISE